VGVDLLGAGALLEVPKDNFFMELETRTTASVSTIMPYLIASTGSVRVFHPRFGADMIAKLMKTDENGEVKDVDLSTNLEMLVVLSTGQVVA
jgi:hypothetical protein